MTSRTNPFRNGILEIFDELSNDMGWHGFKHEIARTTLKGALMNCTEIQAQYYLYKMRKLIDDICIPQRT